VTFSIASGPTLGEVPTDSAGVARCTAWKLPSVPGTYTIAATADNNVTSPTVRLTVKIGPPAQLALLAPVSAAVLSAIEVAARVTDRGGNPVAGTRVDWSITAGAATLTPSTSSADASGIVRMTLTMGPYPGMIHIRGFIPQTALGTDLTASALPGPLCALTPSFNDLSLPVNTPFTSSVQATDCWGDPIPGVVLRPRSGGIQYTLLPTPAMSPSSTVTDANGYATFAGVTAPQPGLQIWLIDGPRGGAWVRVRATGSRGYITAWEATPSTGLTWKIGSGSMDLSFIVMQANGFPAGNKLATFTLAPGNGTFTSGGVGGVFTSTFVSGLTTVEEGLVEISWRPPAIVGTYTMTVQSPGPDDSITPLSVTVRVVP
jgi:Bacterial Ig-like domain (group 1).